MGKGPEQTLLQGGHTEGAESRGIFYYILMASAYPW